MKQGDRKTAIVFLLWGCVPMDETKSGGKDLVLRHTMKTLRSRGSLGFLA